MTTAPKLAFDFTKGAPVGDDEALAAVKQDIEADGLVSPLDRPDVAARAAAAAAGDDDREVTYPVPPSGEVTLPGGVVIDGVLYKDATVRELNGADEEAMSKALATGSIARFIDVVVRRAVERVGPKQGDRDVAAVLEEMLTGDRVYLLQEIRRVTFGDVLNLQIQCPHCGTEGDAEYSISKDVPIRELDLDDPMQRTFDLDLPSGSRCQMRLVDGKAQKAVFTPDNMRTKTNEERNSLLLQQVVRTIDGRGPVTLGMVREGMAAADRRFLLKFLNSHQPGPQYDEVTTDCVDCGESFPIVVDVVTLFRSE